MLLLGTNVWLGLNGGDFNGVSTEYRKSQQELAVLKSAAAPDLSLISEHEEAQLSIVSRLTSHQRKARQHILLGVLATLVTVLVNSLSVTYFIGTGRWCSEVAQTYGLDPSLDKRSRALKRKTFPFAMLAIVTVIAMATLGAAADPGTLRDSTAAWVTPHLLAAMGGTSLIAFALWRQFLDIQCNYQIIDDVMSAVRQVREAKGLDVEPMPVDAAAPTE